MSLHFIGEAGQTPIFFSNEAKMNQWQVMVVWFGKNL